MCPKAFLRILTALSPGANKVSLSQPKRCGGPGLTPLSVNGSIVTCLPECEQCDAQRLRDWQRWIEVLGEERCTERVRGGELVVRAPSGVAIVGRQSLPDSIDPREERE